MPTPDYIVQLRRTYGQGLLLLPGVSGVVLREDLGAGQPHLLLTKRTDNGRWSLPAGIVEPSEQPAATLLRELLEETRVLATIDRLALVVADPELVYPNGDRCQYISLCFRCRYVSGVAEVGDDESTAVGWFAADALPDVGEMALRRIACALDPRGECVFDL